MILNIIKAKMRAFGPHFLIHRIPICFKISQVALDDLTPKIYLCSAPLIAFKKLNPSLLEHFISLFNINRDIIAKIAVLFSFGVQMS